MPLLPVTVNLHRLAILGPQRPGSLPDGRHEKRSEELILLSRPSRPILVLGLMEELLLLEEVDDVCIIALVR
jgi:hypothetical protein